jgi:drug/metabolite transporter (DMT)-like permease
VKSGDIFVVRWTLGLIVTAFLLENKKPWREIPKGTYIFVWLQAVLTCLSDICLLWAYTSLPIALALAVFATSQIWFVGMANWRHGITGTTTENVPIIIALLGIVGITLLDSHSQSHPMSIGTQMMVVFL